MTWTQYLQVGGALIALITPVVMLIRYIGGLGEKIETLARVIERLNDRLDEHLSWHLNQHPQQVTLPKEYVREAVPRGVEPAPRPAREDHAISRRYIPRTTLP